MPATTGAFFSGEYRNMLSEWGKTDEEIQARIDETWNQLFYGNDKTERVYYPVGDDMAYMLDTGNNDVRTEGQSYGMMIAVQLDKKQEFDRIWKWTKTYMYNQSGAYQGYFAWHCQPDGSKIDDNPASDGEIWSGLGPAFYPLVDRLKTLYQLLFAFVPEVFQTHQSFAF